MDGISSHLFQPLAPKHELCQDSAEKGRGWLIFPASPSTVMNNQLPPISTRSRQMAAPSTQSIQGKSPQTEETRSFLLPQGSSHGLRMSLSPHQLRLGLCCPQKSSAFRHAHVSVRPGRPAGLSWGFEPSSSSRCVSQVTFAMCYHPFVLLSSKTHIPGPPEQSLKAAL